MDFTDRRGLKNAAKESLSSAAYSPKKLILIHTGAVLLLSLVLTTVNLLLQRQIEGTGGLSGLGMRSVLSTAQTFLPVLQAVLLPFWEVGLVMAAMQIAREKPATPNTLLTGFRRFGPVLRCELLKELLIFAALMACAYGGMFLYVLSPLSQPLMNALEPLISGSAAVDPVQLMEALDPMLLLPLYIILALLFCLVVIPLMYRYRMAEYILMDDPKAGALRALGLSRAMLRGKRFKLFRLDLSFWWYYLLEALAMVVSYGNVLLPLLGIRLPFSGEVSLILFFVLYLLCILALRYFARDHLEVTYAKAYDALRETLPPPPAPVQNTNYWNSPNNQP